MIDKCSRYDNVMVLGDFNLEPDDIALSSLIQDHDLYDMIKHPTCFKSSKGRCIDLIFTNRKHSFMHSKSFETGEGAGGETANVLKTDDRCAA